MMVLQRANNGKSGFQLALGSTTTIQLGRVFRAVTLAHALAPPKCHVMMALQWANNNCNPDMAA